MNDGLAPLDERIADYMATRSKPWGDEATMREAVKETVRLLSGEARDDFLEMCGLSSQGSIPSPTECDYEQCGECGRCGHCGRLKSEHGAVPVPVEAPTATRCPACNARAAGDGYACDCEGKHYPVRAGESVEVPKP